MLISRCVAWTNINLPCLTRVCPTTTRYLHRNSTQETLSDIHMNINLTTFSRIFSNWICDQVFTVTHFPEWNGSNQAQTITVISFYCGVTQRRQWRACENCSLVDQWLCIWPQLRRNSACFHTLEPAGLWELVVNALCAILDCSTLETIAQHFLF